MDNITHALAGLLVAELVGCWQERRAPRFASRRWMGGFYLTSVAANNLPDLDFVYAGITEGKLGYLLHHRGHTHTLALAVPIALLAYALGLLWLRWRAREHERECRSSLALLALLGPMLHIGMDASNSYGVHPFWPFNSGWLYGDTIFIVEPLFWASLVPVLLAAARAWWWRALLGLLLLATLVLPWVSGMVPHDFCVIVLVWTLIIGFAAWRFSAPARTAAALGASFVILAVFALASRHARAHADELLTRAFPAATTRDVVLSPMPATPICWSVIAVQTEGERLLERRGMLALMPRWLPAAQCPDRVRAQPTAPMLPVQVEADVGSEVVWHGQFAAPLAELQQLQRENCVFAGLLRFARAPFWLSSAPGEQIMGDLRYDRSPELGFAELSAPSRPEICPRFVPPWIPPRADLLEPRPR